jgi:hypothetical protein
MQIPLRQTAIFSALLLSLAIVGNIKPAQAAGVGELIKCPDNPTVYYLGEDGRRHVFPNEHVYHSWYPDFSEVRNVACEDLTLYPMGGRLKYQAGMRLIKTLIDPTVYAVEPDGELRQVPDEETAKALYGDDWAQSVDDIPEVFFIDYRKGQPLAPGEIPEGMVLTDSDGEILRINANGEAESLDVVLDTDQEELFKHHARPLAEIEERLAKRLEKIEFLTSEIDRLTALLEKLKLVQVDDSDIVDVTEVDEIESESGDLLEAEDDISEAEREITEAQNKLNVAKSLLEEAKNYLLLAEEALAAGDYKTAKTNAKLAKEKAMAARGKSVEVIESRRGKNEDDTTSSTDDHSGSSGQSTDDSDKSADSSADDNSAST